MPTVDDELQVYKASSEVFDSTFDPAHRSDLTLDTDDESTGADSVLLITTDRMPTLYVVDRMNMAGTVATLKAPLVFDNPANTAITSGSRSERRERPSVDAPRRGEP